jgi:hypothetical protein
MRRLRPVREHRAVRYERGVAVFGAAMLGALILCHGLADLPLAEAEAPLAVAMREHTVDASGPLPGLVSPLTATVALAGIAPRIWGDDELDLRLTGALGGALALALVVHLGGQLFATRVGALAAFFLVALPAGRLLLGRELGVEPFVAVTSLATLIAIWQLEERRAAAVLAGVAGGATIALSGVSGLWLPAMAIAWLWLGRGLTWGSLAAVTGNTVATLVASAIVLELFARQLSLAPLFDPGHVPGGFRPLLAAWETLPLVPLFLLGLRLMPPGWTSNRAIRFVALWVVLALLARLAGGPVVPAYLGVMLLVAAVVEWSLECASRRTAAATVALSLVCAIVLTRARARADAGEALDRWAVRETGRFLGRVLPTDKRVAASDRVRARLTFYGNRQVERLGQPLPGDGEVDYVVLEHSRVRRSGEGDGASSSDAAKRGSALGEPAAALAPLHSIAEFGGWVVARVGPAATASEKP